MYSKTHKLLNSRENSREGKRDLLHLMLNLQNICGCMRIYEAGHSFRSLRKRFLNLNSVKLSAVYLLCLPKLFSKVGCFLPGVSRLFLEAADFVKHVVYCGVAVILLMLCQCHLMCDVLFLSLFCHAAAPDCDPDRPPQGVSFNIHVQNSILTTAPLELRSVTAPPRICDFNFSKIRAAEIFFSPLNSILRSRC